MNARRALSIAITVLVVAVAGSLLRPVLDHHGDITHAGSLIATEPADTAVVRIAADAARRAVNCDTLAVGCGRLLILRTESRCPTPSSCTVQLLGTVATDGPRAPVAVTVATQWRFGAWLVSEVRT